jgi:sialate O-acetylesterase
MSQANLHDKTIRIHRWKRTAFAAIAGMVVLFLGSVAYSADPVPKNDASPAAKEFVLHSLFQSNMVIQCAKPIIVWGWSTPGDKISVTFAAKTATATAGKDRLWKATLPAMEACSKPATMTIEGKSGKVTLENILIGDVWIAGGQSNMQFRLSAVDDGDLEVASANFPQIRLLTIPKIFGPELKKNFPRSEEFSRISGETTTDGDWAVCTPKTVGNFTAIGYVMARRLHMVTQVPIGIINTSRGGTTVEAWAPMARLRKSDVPVVKELLAKHDKRLADYDPKAELAKQIRKYEGKIAGLKKAGKKIPANMTRPTGPVKDTHMSTHRPPGNCFGSVISPIAGFAVKGAIFHQGYNNCFSGVWGATMYRSVFPEMIRGWREAFGDPKMPFGILSQCVAGKVQSLDNFLPYMTDIGARLREAQYQTFLEFRKAGDKNIGFASTYDLRHVSYHPRVKLAAGERIARWALETQYGMAGKFTWLPPMIKEVKAQDGTLVLIFDQKVAPVADGSPVEGFAIAGKDGKFQRATSNFRVISKGRRHATYDNTMLILSSPLVPEPVYYRYAWGRSPMGNLRAKGVPLATQRSDSWTNIDLYKVLTGKDPAEPGTLSRGENRLLAQALANEDTRRMIEEAKALLKQAEEAKAKAQAKEK